MILLRRTGALLLVLLAACGTEPVQKAAENSASATAPAREDAFCSEHGVLEAVCTKCNPALILVFKAKGDWCEEHEFPESFCPICHPERGGRPAVDVKSDGAPPDGTRVTFKTKDAARLAEIQVVKAIGRSSRSIVTVTARIVYDGTKVAEITTDPMGVELSDVFMTLKPREVWKRASTQDELVRVMSDELSVLPGLRMIFTQPIEMRVNEMIAGIRADVGVKLFGDDFEVLKSKATEIEALLKTVPGAADVFTEQVTGQPVLEITADRGAMARQGIPVKEVLGVVEALGTREAGTMQDGEMRFPIALRHRRRVPHGHRRAGPCSRDSGQRRPDSSIPAFEYRHRRGALHHQPRMGSTKDRRAGERPRERRGELRCRRTESHGYKGRVARRATMCG